MRVLSPRQREIAELLVRGWTDREIAAALGVAKGTIKTQLQNMLNKTSARNRTELAIIFQQGKDKADE